MFTNIAYAHIHYNHGKMSLCCQAILVEEAQDVLKNHVGLGKIRGFRCGITQNVFTFVVNCRPDQYEVQDLYSGHNIDGVWVRRESTITFKDKTVIVLCHTDPTTKLDITECGDLGSAAEQMEARVRKYLYYPPTPQSQVG